MAVLDILRIPDERLKRQAQPVEDVAAIQGFIDDMLETMYQTSDGIGLAATQVGSTHAVIVIDLSEERNSPTVVINPQIVEQDGEYEGEEGCLSVPGYYAKVKRYSRVKVVSLDREGNEQIFDTDEFLAIVLQHEIDHLKGKIFIEHLSSMKQQMALKKVRKLKD
ncbi:peptide deformylase 3 [Shewanella sp. NFH-SH190041]|uniref:peptide deformylase n=1 Tax=Shewanella sp. NFH-SH190041 TaxID=2950245 RepID=UPI0021C3AB3B|nr:peptide deformylase [Shewanella sp. NFH-SH190041]BDM64500.1 peptide deformylase 3 [Shewanella sp. NFH-SH190041]